MPYDSIIESLSTGLLFISKDHKIQMVNTLARKTLGTFHRGPYYHEEGQIEAGDIVLLAVTDLGGDDGGLVPADLELLGIKNNDIRYGDALLVSARYRSKKKPLYQYYRKDTIKDSVELKDKYQSLELSCSIDFEKRLVSIQVNEKNFQISYFQSLGSIVVIDPLTLTVKFFQSLGYSYKKETIKHLLHGKHFLAKREGPTIDLQGMQLEDFFGPCTFIEDVDRILFGELAHVKDTFYEIHNRHLLCSIMPVMEGGEIKGATVELTESSTLPGLLSARNKLIRLLEEKIYPTASGESSKDDKYRFIHGHSTKMKEIQFLTKKASQVHSTVLITGENGTGKTMAAREIHALRASNTPFIEFNCASIPQSLFESELFGYLPGSFTGALATGKKGYLQAAQGGTIFLDEITEIPPSIQVKLLHVLQDKRFYSIGSNTPIELNARIIAATNSDIQKEIRTGRLREDLYYRLNVFSIHIPPLRERREDLHTLIQAIMSRIQNNYGLEKKELSSSVLDLFMSYDWPGNIRELENVLERAMLVCETQMIFPEHVSLSKQEAHYTLKDVRDIAEKKAIQDCLLMTKNKSELAELLGISRTTLYEKLVYYDLKI
jgi:transcriptional regulator with PAS, ATPase and Fis domain